MKLLLAFASLIPFVASDNAAGYEVWASDQSNTAPGQPNLGVRGGFLWIYDSDDVEAHVAGSSDAVPLPCTPGSTKGPCNTLDMFPQDLEQYDASGPTGKSLGELPGFGRLHGVLKDPFDRYVVANFFAPDGGFVGVVDVKTKEAIGLFRVTMFDFAGKSDSRSVHMSFWSADGSAIIVSNLHGKAVERINVQRDEATNDITNLFFDTSATLGLGSSMVKTEDATYFVGNNAWGNPLMGEVINDYANADLSDLTPKGFCKENGCGSVDGGDGGRVNNVPICPLPSFNDNLYITMGGGGLLVADLKATPMAIVGEYGRDVVYGAGCGGTQAVGKMFLNSGVSASPAGFDQSYFAVWAFDDSGFPSVSEAADVPENFPEPEIVYEDDKNGGTFLDGQIPGETVRRDSHGAVTTVNGLYVHVVDRIQNVVEVFNTNNFERSTYDLTTFKGQGHPFKLGACDAASVVDFSNTNDPSPDLFEATPDGKYLMVALRGPAPVSVPHSAQGSCPGVGVIKLEQNDKIGSLVSVLRATNEIEDALDTVSPVGGIPYKGPERADVHGCIVVAK